MVKLHYDLHIHSCLSPCGHDDMTPGNIVGMAMLKGLDVIAVTDHNSCKNCGAVMALAEEYGILAIPGMEITTAEEVHVVCLFEELADALAFDQYVYERMMPFPNDSEIFGRQQICDENDEVIGEEPLLLINGVDISFDELWDVVDGYHGVMIPAHIEKSANSVTSNLGFIPPDSKFHVVEMKQPEKKEALLPMNPHLAECKIIRNSDAHYLEDIHEAVESMEVEEKTVKCVLAYLRSTN